VPLYEAEARITGSYERLVRTLIEDGRLDDARRWAREGIERVGSQSPGIANQLQAHLREMAQREGDWPFVAARRAEEFFAYPSVAGLGQLEEAAEKAGCGPEVRAAALHFLETGNRPAPTPVSPAPVSRSRSRPPAGKGAKASRPTAAPPAPAWPLPDPFAGTRPQKKADPHPHGPHFDVLLALAIKERRPDDVLRWYDRMTESRRGGYYGWGGEHFSAGVADAVADAHPDRALAIYRKIIEGDIARTSPSAYEAALPYLRKVRALLQKLNRHAEWARYLAELREKHRRKTRLMEVLDRLDARPIVDR
jgi:uncharacterized Zn finger protein